MEPILLNRTSRLLCLAAATTATCCACSSASAQSDKLPDAPSSLIASRADAASLPVAGYSSSAPADEQAATQQQTDSNTGSNAQHGEPIQQPEILPQQKRIFGVMSNYTSVSGGTKAQPAGWRTDSQIAWKQSTDYTSFGFGLVTSAIAFGQDSHPSLDTVSGGNAPYWAYAWRGLVDKTDQVVQGTLFFPALLHQDTRYYAMGTGSKLKRTLHAMDSVVIARSYSGNPVFNIAGLAGKVGTQALSTTYYPAGSEGFGVLAEKFVYALLRQAGFTVLREFSPDLSQRLHIHVKGSN